MSPPRFRLAFAALSLVLCSACQLDVAVGVEAAADGRGEVRVTAVLDKEAARLVGDVRERLRTGDLREAGWDVDATDGRRDGSVVVVARRPFVGDEEAARALADLDDAGGHGGPFERFTLRQRRTFWKTTTTFSGDVDLARGLDAFADAELLERLGGSGTFGVPTDQLERRFGAPLENLFDLEVAVDLPGRSAMWTPELGEQTSLSVTAEQWNVRNLALAGAAVACGLAALVVLALGRRSGVPSDLGP